MSKSQLSAESLQMESMALNLERAKKAKEMERLLEDIIFFLGKYEDNLSGEEVGLLDLVRNGEVEINNQVITTLKRIAHEMGLGVAADIIGVSEDQAFSFEDLVDHYTKNPNVLFEDPDDQVEAWYDGKYISPTKDRRLLIEDKAGDRLFLNVWNVKPKGKTLSFGNLKSLFRFNK